MPPVPEAASKSLQRALKLAVLALVVATLGLPINDLLSYALLLAATLALSIACVQRSARRWMGAIVIVFVVIAIKWVLAPPKIEEGHNVFVTGGTNNALVSGLPAQVYDAAAGEFERAYPVQNRCDAAQESCWIRGRRPDRAYAFSFDGIYDRPLYSRRVSDIDFSNATWQRLGFINEIGYNWYPKTGDIVRGYRPRGPIARLASWRTTLPHFVMFSLPAAYAGSRLCWRGHVMWEEAKDRFTSSNTTDWSCRTLKTDDAGKRIFGLSIGPNADLAMRLEPTASIRLQQIMQPVLTIAGVGTMLMLLLRLNFKRLVLPVMLTGLSLAVIALSDVTLLGGLRPFDAGNDGLIYDGYARIMMQSALAGDIRGALQGVEPVFYYTPGTRYLRAVEHAIFGETSFGYVSLLLWLPFLMHAAFRRYFGTSCAIAMALIFIVVPVGALFGSTFYIYVKHASTGFGDPAGVILFLAGYVALIGRTRDGPSQHASPAFAGGLLLALAVFVRPNFAIGAAILLGGAGLAALWQGQFARLAAMSIGFIPVLGMALHNWYFGGVFVLFSQHTSNAVGSMPMPPHEYATALLELVRFDLAGDALRQAMLQIGRMLLGPSESPAMIPVHVIAFAVLFRVLFSVRYDGWLRLTSATALGLYVPSLFFLYSDRYALAAWLLTLLVCAVWTREESLPWLERRHPGTVSRVLNRPPIKAGVYWLDRIAMTAESPKQRS